MNGSCWKRFLLAGAMLALLGPASRAQDAPAAPAAPPLELPDDPLVRALMQTNPREPQDVVAAVLTLDDLGAPAVGKALLTQLLATNPNPQVLADLADRFGSAAMLRIGRVPGLQPEGEQLSSAALSAAATRDNDPQWIAGQIEALTNGTPKARAAARVSLRRAGAPAAAAMAAALADPNRAAEAPAVRGALVAGDARFVPPLLAVLESDDATLRGEALAILAKLDGFDAPQWLDHVLATDPNSPTAAQAAAILRDRFGRNPHPVAASKRLRRLAEDHLAGRLTAPTEADGSVLVWSWDAASRSPIAQPMSPAEAARHWALVHLAQAQRLAPDDRTIRQLRAGLLLAQTTMDPPSEKVLAEVNDLSAADVEAVLESAMTAGDVAAACGAARRLGQVGTVDGLLYSRAPSPCPLVKALKSPHPLLRSAALAAVLRLDPQRPFPGASYVTDTLTYFAHARGKPRAVIAHRSTAEGQRLAGLLAQLGYDPEVVVDGAALARRAADSPDVALVLLDTNFLRPGVEGAVDWLRVDPTTSLLPLLLVATADSHDRATQLARRDARTHVLVSPLSLDQMQAQLAAIHPELAKPTAHPEALQLAQGAIESMGALLAAGKQADSPALVGTLIESLRVPQLAGVAAAELAKIPSREVQRALAEAVAQTTLTTDARLAIAKAFAANVASNGVRLTPEEVLAQYDVYNRSRRDDDDSRVVMGHVLDAMELAAAYAADDDRARSGDSPGG